MHILIFKGDDGDSIMEYNGGCVLAMAGKNCVAIASDTRFGIKNRTISVGTFPKAFKINDTCFVGISGLATDIQTMCVTKRYYLLAFCYILTPLFYANNK